MTASGNGGASVWHLSAAALAGIAVFGEKFCGAGIRNCAGHLREARIPGCPVVHPGDKSLARVNSPEYDTAAAFLSPHYFSATGIAVEAERNRAVRRTLAEQAMAAHTPHFQYIAHPGACRKAPVVPHNRRPRPAGRHGAAGRDTAF